MGKKHTPEQIVVKLRQAEAEISGGAVIGLVGLEQNAGSGERAGGGFTRTQHPFEFVSFRNRERHPIDLFRATCPK